MLPLVSFQSYLWPSIMSMYDNCFNATVPDWNTFLPLGSRLFQYKPPGVNSGRCHPSTTLIITTSSLP